MISYGSGFGVAMLLVAMPAVLPAQTFAVGSRVRSLLVCARGDTLVTGTGCGTGNVLRPLGDKGTILRGPAGSTTPFGLSWFVHYDTPPDGWSTQLYLALDSTVPPPPVPATVQINAPGLTLYPNGATALHATVRDAAGAILTTPVVWTTSNALVATVDSTGLVTARGLGVDTITATAGLARSRSIVTVEPAPPVPPRPLLVCGVSPPPVGCGMSIGNWSLLGVRPTNQTYGPWFILDSLGYKFKTVRVVVTDTTP